MTRRHIVGAIIAGLVFAATLAVVTALELKRSKETQPGSPASKQVMAEAERYGVIPGRMGPLELTRKATGPEAIDRFSRLTGRQVRLVDAAYAEYAEESGHARLWIGWVSDERTANRAVNDVRDEVVAGDSPYAGLSESRFDGVPVFEFEGLSQNHAFFALSNRVIWVSADTGVYKTTLLYLLDRLSR